ncbi:hypothetical protein HA464_06735 [Rhizobium leguminosarum bv. trifolii]|uniref:hypothetical protein n=1 Tax=Rhizobium ruizarguesonis TaxID=2081791 RepID=UPI001030C606|nr:hypothetical protein [Rhizobium ruizarguesonis]QIO43723.1 hypothetical protein HA464_06735 [Rhizobium leguminosarum bv. trifolii]TBE87041.1 hypothetical protein ELG99_09345 [Rhizobium ruizarguesonis]
MQLTSALVVKYLANLGWDRRTTTDNNIVRIQPPESLPGARSILFSVNARAEGEAREVRLAIDIIQDTYGKTALEIEKGVAALSHDLVLGKVPDEYLRNDTIELRGVRSYMNGMRGLLANSATTEMTGHRAFPKSTRAAFDYADQCGFGHTFRGSFGLVIEAPLGGGEQTALDFADPVPPLGRRVVQRIASGLASVSVAVKNDDAEAIVENKNGLNAGMCKDLISIIKQSGIPRIQLSFEWSSEVKAPAIGIGDYSIEARQMRVLQQAHKRLSEDEEPIPVVIVGRIVDLHSDANPADADEKGTRSIQINWDSEDYGMKKVIVKLDAKQYLVAHQAHGRGQLVQVAGELSPRRPWTLGQVTSLEPMVAVSSGR